MSSALFHSTLSPVVGSTELRRIASTRRSISSRGSGDPFAVTTTVSAKVALIAARTLDSEPSLSLSSSSPELLAELEPSKTALIRSMDHSDRDESFFRGGGD